MSDTLYFLLSGGCTLLVLFGINRMSKVKQAVLGNRISGIAVALAMVLTAYRYQIFSAWTLYIVMIIALGLGFVASRKIAMIDMPQTVAVLNGFGGLASLLVAYATALVSGNDPFALITSNIAIAVGALTLTGSLIAGGKLARILNAQPQSLKFHSLWQGLLLIAMIYFIAIAQNPLITLILALVWGIIFVMRVGGADMPITISLLNSFSGVAGGIAGMAVNEPLLVAIGGIVGASGLILTQDMCKAMNRSLISILTGKTTAKPEKAAAPVQKETADQLVVEKEIELDPFEQADQVLRNAKKVIIVPGYGMALSQAQQAVATLAQKLKDQGTEVKYAIHPVAGRMPGHMSVLLCEADVDYSELYMMEDINDDFKDADAVIVVGANDVTNPSANTAEGTPIYGMPILNVEDAQNIIICNFDTKPGYAGVDNPLYTSEKTTMLLGDAKETVNKLVTNLIQAPKASHVATSVEENNHINVLRNAKKVIIVPGYGMALSQAQQAVATLAQKLKDQGTEVKYAIHPVAGRMPGHMSVLLCEADVDYSELYMMEDINDDFKDADAVIVVGANDVTNPSANTAEGTPIYGMPILNVEDAQNIIICNFDTKPGYAGVDNPLYTSEKTTMLLGDAKETVNKLITDLAQVPQTTEDSENNPVQVLRDAKKVIIVPGYGMALSQAQQAVATLAQKLKDQGSEVKYAIHPVAGRMPGHMSVLLCEADVDYSELYMMEDINDDFKDADVVIVVGANDVTNPSANTAEGTPIYGMPILNVEDAQNIIICNFDTKPGYAGVDNPLYTFEKTTMLLGDAKETVNKLITDLAQAPQTAEKTTEDVVKDPIKVLHDAKKVIVVPGYGMALSQAQQSVANLAQKLKDQGTEVKYAIHPVAGRMPGHMSVLLCEANIDYSELYMMEDINEDFKDVDAVIVVGANDVTNPAANTAEGTPIYGMPILNVEDAPQIIICNFDTKPGYAGVDNPLYTLDKTIMLLGDAKETVDKLIADF